MNPEPSSCSITLQQQTSLNNPPLRAKLTGSSRTTSHAQNTVPFSRVTPGVAGAATSLGPYGVSTTGVRNTALTGEASPSESQIVHLSSGACCCGEHPAFGDLLQNLKDAIWNSTCFQAPFVPHSCVVIIS